MKHVASSTAASPRGDVGPGGDVRDPKSPSSSGG
jgi:hypothetical protein